MIGVRGDDAALERALRELAEAWAETGHGWRDAARDDFARDHLGPIEERLREASRAVKAMESLIDGVRRQCT